MNGCLLSVVFGIASASALAQDHVVPVLRERTADVQASLDETSRSIVIPFGTEAIMDEAVRFTASFSLNGQIETRDFDFLLFKDATPITTANLLGYVDRGDYLESIIHRNVGNFVIQGGGFTVADTDTGITFGSVPTQATIENEFAVSNTLGTLSMAKTSLGPNTATSQWFVSTNTNNDNLDLQNGGFTVFGRLSKDTLPAAITLNQLSDFFEANFGGALSNVPLVSGTTQETLDKTDFYRFTNVTRVPLPTGQAGTSTELTYRIASASGADSISGTLDGNTLNLTYQQPQRGDSKRFRIEAIDSVGNVVEDDFVVRMVESYDNWKESRFTGTDLTNPSVSGPEADPDGDGITNAQLYAHGDAILDSGRNFLNVVPSSSNSIIEFRYPIRPDLSTPLRIIVEVADSLDGSWEQLPNTRFSTSNQRIQRIIQVEPSMEGKDVEFFRIRTTLVL